MRPSFRIAFVAAAWFALFAEAACGDEGAATNLGGTADAGKAPRSDGPRANDASADRAISTMRIAHLAPSIGPVDFCYQRARSGTFIGPVLGYAAPSSLGSDAGETTDAEAEAEAPDAGRIQASYRSLSKYLTLDAEGPITIAVVQGGATSCANPLATGSVTLDPGKLSTVVLFGAIVDGGAATEIGSFTDDRTTTSDKARVRIIHAALGTTEVPPTGPIAVRVVGAKTTVLTDRVEPRRAGAESAAIAVDTLGYVATLPMPAPAAIAIGPAATTGGADAGFPPWQSGPADLDLRGGSLHTAFVLSGPTEAAFEVLWCADTTTRGDETSCQVVE